ncbi:hypothetical protein [Streptomyces sp. 2A115]|uniref:hypothetical protein n=1 Tax=Streptomyces sp. 2A115 TaxID=3457439 RepID=UPI003FD5A91B
MSPPVPPIRGRGRAGTTGGDRGADPVGSDADGMVLLAAPPPLTTNDAAPGREPAEADGVP